ncbi:unnamed protein product, partial [Tetraodon nigroviridis]
MVPAEDGAQLRCCVALEQLDASGQAARRQLIRRASVILGRNEFQEIVLRIHDGKVQQSYLLKDFKLFTKFAKDGKSTVKLVPENIQVLISNCPPDQLSLFLRTLSVKHQAWQAGKPLSDREKLKAALPRSFEAISPLQQKDVQKANELRARAAPPGLQDRNNVAAPAGRGQQVKRYRKVLPAEENRGFAPSKEHLRHSQHGSGRVPHRRNHVTQLRRSVRRSPEPFGGIQLIVCGDFLQLPPVSKGKEKASFCFQARSWRKVIQVNMELTEVRRQTDQLFISLLQAVRVGRVTEDVTARLLRSADHQIERDGILATRLCTHKDDVELTNENKLKQLPGSLHVFEALDSHPALVKAIDAHSPVGRSIQLKVGAQVMLTKNLDVTRGLVNGARGVVVAFESGKHGLPHVRFLCGVTQALKPERWVFKSAGGTHLSRQQLPLKLAWAISIHKSQGMTLDCVEISLARVFESGQAYVALSRARSLEGLRVMDFDPRVVRADPDVLLFYKKLRKERLLT